MKNPAKLTLKVINVLACAILFLLALSGVSFLINAIIAAGLLMPIMLACLCLSVATIPGNSPSTTLLTAFLPFSLYLIAAEVSVGLYRYLDNKINAAFADELYTYPSKPVSASHTYYYYSTSYPTSTSYSNTTSTPSNNLHPNLNSPVVSDL